jgi:CheY-like chemotaxis protein
VISGYVQILLQERGDAPGGREYLERIDRSVKRAAELVRGLLTFSRKAERRPQRLDLNQEVEQAVRLLERTIPKMISIATNLAPDLRPIVADSAQLEQVLVNLASNAKDAMPEGGILTLETSGVHIDGGAGSNPPELPPGEYVRLKVSDTGSGMDRQTMEHIFEPFFTTKEVGKGTGLGLATVYGIVKSHEGFITCRSQPDRGAAFSIYFPASRAMEAMQAAASEATTEVEGGQERILLVDDERAILDIASNALEHHGYGVLLAESGETALKVLQQCGGEVDLMVLDLGMPGMGGKRCLKEALALYPDLKVLIASGYASQEQMGRSRQEGAADFIGKPYRLEDLLRKIRLLLDPAPEELEHPN